MIPTCSIRISEPLIFSFMPVTSGEDVLEFLISVLFFLSLFGDDCMLAESSLPVFFLLSQFALECRPAESSSLDFVFFL